MINYFFFNVNQILKTVTKTIHLIVDRPTYYFRTLYQIIIRLQDSGSHTSDRSPILICTRSLYPMRFLFKYKNFNLTFKYSNHNYSFT